MTATELTVRQPALDVTAYEPKNLTQAVSMAKVIANSGLLGKGVAPKPETVLFLMARGRELGFTATQSLSAFHIIDGMPTLTAQAKVALCQRSPLCRFIRMVESTGEQATWETQRVSDPEPTRHTFTMAEARAMGLADKDQWKKQPKTMLRWRAATALIAMVYPDLVLGLYDPEESEEVAAAQGRVAADTSIQVIDTVAVEQQMAETAASFPDVPEEPEPEGDTVPGLDDLASNPSVDPVPGVDRPFQDGDWCPECLAAKPPVHARLKVAKGGRHAGSLQCVGKSPTGTYLDHLAPAGVRAAQTAATAPVEPPRQNVAPVVMAGQGAGQAPVATPSVPDVPATPALNPEAVAPDDGQRVTWELFKAKFDRMVDGGPDRRERAWRVLGDVVGWKKNGPSPRTVFQALSEQGQASAYMELMVAEDEAKRAEIPTADPYDQSDIDF